MIKVPMAIEAPHVEATSLTWVTGGQLPADQMNLGAADGAAVSIRHVSVEDQERWRDQRRVRMMGFGALGDQGEPPERSYVYLPIPEWVLDSCTTCVEVTRSAPLPTGLADDQLFSAGLAASDAG